MVEWYFFVNNREDRWIGPCKVRHFTVASIRKLDRRVHGIEGWSSFTVGLKEVPIRPTAFFYEEWWFGSGRGLTAFESNISVILKEFVVVTVDGHNLELP
ncbi:hypothetical protein Tco_0737629 [Tanacetum coccineum]